LIAVLFGIPLTIWATGAQGTKDFGDERGDEKFGVMTFPVKLGRERAIKWIWKLMLLGFLTLNLFVLLNLLPISFAILNILVIPSMLIPITLKMNIKIEKMENTASWVLFYGTLGLWYLLPPLLV
jgi:4-hydroxybenzoate polyprenyltransferase